MRQLLVALLARYTYKPHEMESFDLPLVNASLAVSRLLC